MHDHPGPYGNGRSAYWDDFRGILAILVVFGHFMWDAASWSRPAAAIAGLIYAFHMPAFAFASGALGRGKSGRDPAFYARLAFLYPVFAAAGYAASGQGSLLSPSLHCWYLLAIAVWRLATPRLAGIRHILPIMTIAGLLCGFFPAVDNTLAIGRIMAFWPFYMAGYELGPDGAMGRLRPSRKERAGIVLAFGAGYAIAAYRLLGLAAPPSGAFLMDPYAGLGHLVFRMLLYVAAGCMVLALSAACPGRSVPGLAVLGRNGLWIYLFHRFPVLLLGVRMRGLGFSAFLLASAACTAVLCAACGNDIIGAAMDRIADAGGGVLLGRARFRGVPAACLCLAAAYAAYAGLSPLAASRPADVLPDSFPPVLSAQEEAALDDAFRITFAGDLILLEEQVKRGRQADGTYDFHDVFERAEPYISSADLAIGVLEGPLPGPEAGYSTSDYGDGKELALGFPDAFAEAARDAGFDLVSTASNHVLDNGPEAAARTLDVLDAIGLDHAGSYRSPEEKASGHVRLVEKDGIRMAFLAYTYGSNGCAPAELALGDLDYITSIAGGVPGDGLFERLAEDVRRGFEAAKALEPDLIVVLPHMGTQFSNVPDAVQEAWFELFIECGADIILGDHAHAVQPAGIEAHGGRDVFVAYCPGNFANIYREYGGDASVLIDVYIDRESKAVIGGAVVPLYIQSPADGNYRALPVHAMMHDPALRAELSTDDLARADEACRVATEAALGMAIPAASLPERAYFDGRGVVRRPVRGLELSDGMRDGALWRALSSAESVCFVGDSVTEGTRNGGAGWQEPLLEHLEGKAASAYAKGGYTVRNMLDDLDRIPDAELYVVALGANDIRYRNPGTCAMDADAYIASLEELERGLRDRNVDAAFVYIAPWPALDGDPYRIGTYAESRALYDAYTAALRDWAAAGGRGFSDPGGIILDALSGVPDDAYLLDHIHPDATDGVVLYAKAALLG